ncbi:MAG: hypothetical protein ACLQED_01555 [Desulfobaccales bacterium]
MNRKHLVLTMAALVGILLLALTCGVALADPVFYVKIDNKTDIDVKIKYNWSTPSGEYGNEAKMYTIPAHTTSRFTGPRGNEQMNVWMHTGGEGGIIKNYKLKGDLDSQAPDALYNITGNNEGHLRMYKDNE